MFFSKKGPTLKSLSEVTIKWIVLPLWGIFLTISSKLTVWAETLIGSGEDHYLSVGENLISKFEIVLEISNSQMDVRMDLILGVEVVANYFLLPHLSWADLLQLRGTCHTARTIVDEYLKLNPKLIPFMQINEHNRRIEDIKRSTIPFVGVYLQNTVSGPMFFENNKEHLGGFLRRHGDRISFCRVANASFFPVGSELTFFESLVNLTELHVDYLGFYRQNLNGSHEWLDQILGEVESSGASSTSSNTFDEWNFNSSLHDGCESRLLRLRASRRCLVFCDDEERHEQVVRDMATPVWVFHHTKEEESENGFRGHCVVSLMDIQPNNTRCKLDNVNTLVIRASARNCMWRFDSSSRPRMDSLANLEIILDDSFSYSYDITECGTPVYLNSRPCEHLLFSYMFSEVVWPKMRKLRLCFEGNSKGLTNTCDIVSACPLLTNLCLVNWPEDAEMLMIKSLISGLSFIRELTLDSCARLDEQILVGNDPEEHIWHNFKNLDKLEFRNLDRMTGFTDRAFADGIANLPLKEFVISSSTPIETVTCAGFIALSKGVFAKTIKHFPFCGWSLKNVSQEEHQNIGKLF